MDYLRKKPGNKGGRVCKGAGCVMRHAWAAAGWKLGGLPWHGAVAPWLVAGGLPCTPHSRVLPSCLLQPAAPLATDLMNRLGLYLRSRKLAPDVQLKRFIQQHCAGRVVVLES